MRMGNALVRHYPYFSSKRRSHQFQQKTKGFTSLSVLGYFLAMIAAEAQAKTNWRDIIVVVAVAWVARLAFMWLIPPAARSFDAFAWEHQALLLKNGINPYQPDNFFNWPPFWMQCVFIISKIAGGLNVSFFRVLQVFLIVSETAVIAVTVRLIQMLAPAVNVRALTIIGIALNPPAIFLICQHCNFDVIMVLWVLLAIACLMRYNTSGNLIDWLSACLFLGLGILTKTVPLVLFPLLAGGFRKATPWGKLLGAALVLGPAALGVSIIYVLLPAEVTRHVLGYQPGGFPPGFGGLLYLMDCREFSNPVHLAFYILGIGVMALTWHHLWTRHSLGNRELILYTALVLMLIAGEGTGFSAQYFYWFLPFLVITYACYTGLWRKLLIGFGIVSAITFIINYGMNSAYGYSFLYLFSHTQKPTDFYTAVKESHDASLILLAKWSYLLSVSGVEALDGLPLFIAGIVVLVFGTRILLNTVEGLRKKWVLGLAGFYVFCIVAVFGTAICVKVLDPGNTSPTDSSSSQTNQDQ
jgi:hypothetical protein